MKHEPIDKNWVPDKKAGYQVPAPSEFLREKILSEASNVWDEDLKVESNNTWMMPALRLAASITIAMLIVSFANKQSQHSLTLLQSSKPTTKNTENTKSNDQWFEHPFSPMRIRKVAISSRNQGTPKDLILHMQQLRNAVEDTTPNTTPTRRHSTEILIQPWQLNHLNNTSTTLLS